MLGTAVGEGREICCCRGETSAEIGQLYRMRICHAHLKTDRGRDEATVKPVPTNPLELARFGKSSGLFSPSFAIPTLRRAVIPKYV